MSFLNPCLHFGPLWRGLELLQGRSERITKADLSHSHRSHRHSSWHRTSSWGCNCNRPSWSTSGETVVEMVAPEMLIPVPAVRVFCLAARSAARASSADSFYRISACSIATSTVAVSTMVWIWPQMKRTS